MVATPVAVAMRQAAALYGSTTASTAASTAATGKQQRRAFTRRVRPDSGSARASLASASAANCRHQMQHVHLV
jgi:hypothetical protein